MTHLLSFGDHRQTAEHKLFTGLMMKKSHLPRQLSLTETFSSPLTAMLSSVGGGTHDDKALKHAFYNTAALVFLALSAAAAVAVYFVLEAFLRPLLWAALCGAFLYPFKRKLTEALRGYLQSLSESNTPLVGLLAVPLHLTDSFSETVGRFLVEKIRILIVMAIAIPCVYWLYVFQPFMEILWFLETAGTFLYILLDCFKNPYVIWTVTIGYLLIVIFWWTPSSSKVLCYLSLPVWTALLVHLSSIAGAFRLPLFLIVVVLCIIGAVAEASDGKDHVDGKVARKLRRRSLLQGLSVKAAAVLGSPIAESSDSSEEEHENPSPTKPSISSPSVSPEHGKDCVDGKNIPSVPKRKLHTVRDKRVRLRRIKGSPSRPYFLALIWAIVLVRLYLNPVILLLFVLPIIYFIIKVVLKVSGLWNFICDLTLSWYDVVKVWFLSRQAALAPPPVKGLIKLMIKGDQMVNAFTRRRMDNLVSLFMVLFLIVMVVLVAVLLAYQVHHESVYLITVTGNLVNDVMQRNPQLLQWYSNNTEYKKAFESSVERAYMFGRQWIASKVHTVLGSHHSNTSQLEQRVLDLTDRLYHSWMSKKNGSVTLGENDLSTKRKGDASALTQWKNVMTWFVREGIFFKFDASEIISVVKENLGTLTAFLESLWLILKGNVNIIFSLVTTILSMLFFSGSYLLNTGLSLVVFITALFYLLCFSGEQYKPVEWFSKYTGSGTSGFGETINIAVRDVFEASLKMAAFYGLYTWFTHTLFQINIVFIPSAIAAIAAVVPFVGTYVAAVPAVLELWLVQDKGILALILAICHLLPTYFVDVAIYSEISGGSHPYLTGLAVAGGIYCLGLEGAVIGPIVLCCLLVAGNVYGNMLGKESSVATVNVEAIKSPESDVSPDYSELISENRPKAATMT